MYFQETFIGFLACWILKGRKFRGFQLAQSWLGILSGSCIFQGLLRHNQDRSLDQVVDGLEASLEQQQNLPGLPREGPGGPESCIG